MAYALIKYLLLTLALFSGVNSQEISKTVENGCISFSVSQGTGCQWMYSLFSNQLDTDEYFREEYFKEEYFKDEL